MGLTSRQQSLLPTSDEVRFFREHGWYVSSEIIDAHELAETRYGVERFYAGNEDSRLPSAIASKADWFPTRSSALRMNDFIAQRKHEVRRLAFNPLIAATAALLIGTSQIRLFASTLVLKPSGCENRVGWHTDRAYWKNCTSEKMLTAWIPLQDCTARMGTLSVLDGSHAWPARGTIGELQLARQFLDQDDSFLARLESAGVSLLVKTIELRAGQVSFHHCLTFHGSGPNLSPVDRYAISIHMQDRDNRYGGCSRDGWRHNTEYFFRRTDDDVPDFNDPYYCPVMWDITGAT